MKKVPCMCFVIFFKLTFFSRSWPPGESLLTPLIMWWRTYRPAREEVRFTPRASRSWSGKIVVVVVAVIFDYDGVVLAYVAGLLFSPFFVVSTATVVVAVVVVVVVSAVTVGIVVATAAAVVVVVIVFVAAVAAAPSATVAVIVIVLVFATPCYTLLCNQNKEKTL